MRRLPGVPCPSRVVATDASIVWRDSLTEPREEAELHRRTAEKVGHDVATLPVGINSHGFIAENSQDALDIASTTGPGDERQRTRPSLPISALQALIGRGQIRHELLQRRHHYVVRRQHRQRASSA